MPQRTILLIEDEADILEVMAYNLSREGYRVVAVRDGEQGLAAAQKVAPDLVVLDLMLPGLDGLEVCRRLKRDSRTARVPVIMVTARGGEGDVALGLGAGAAAYVTKPFSPKDLIARVRVVVEPEPASGGLGAPQRNT